MTDQQFQEAVLEQLSSLGASQKTLEGRIDRTHDRLDGIDHRLDRLDGRMDQLEGRLGALEDRMRRGFEETQRLLSEVFQSPIAEGVELYSDRIVREHVEQYHSEPVAA